jgi:hypothetical protein
MKCPVEFCKVILYPGEVSTEDRATLESDPSAGGISGEEGEAERCPFLIFDLFPGPPGDELQGSGRGEIILCNNETEVPDDGFFNDVVERIRIPLYPQNRQV